jgi:hypothetical protein
MKSFLRNYVRGKCIMLIFFIVSGTTLLPGQVPQKYYIKGQLKEQKSLQGVAFATIALRGSKDSTLITGTASNIAGEFNMESLISGKYCLIISAIGYNRKTINIDLTDNYDAGTILIQEKSVTLGEIVVVGERIKAKAESDRITYFMNKKMYDVSNNGIDLLTYIPGVRVDLMKNISLEGSQNIKILVDGIERDKNFLSQLSASQIDKVDVITTPDSRYDSDITGVVNIILRKDELSGINGHIHVEIPTSQSVIYAFPDYSLNYSFKRINLYTSYNGELSYFDIIQKSARNYQNSAALEINSDQILRQKDWSHRFHYGFDYILNDKNLINFYGYYNPYSNELNGIVNMIARMDGVVDQQWSALKKDEDINRSAFYSLYYKHGFKKAGREISIDLTYVSFKAENTTSYLTTLNTYSENPTDQLNTVKPRQNSVSFKIDYSSPVTSKFRFDTGIKTKSQKMYDNQSSEFKYLENIFSLYGTIAYSLPKITMSAGIRAEESISRLTDNFNKNLFVLMPVATIDYKPVPKRDIKLSYSSTVYRPNIYELNPYISTVDPYTTENGNPDLKPEIRRNISIDFSGSNDNNYVSLQLFFKQRVDAINHFAFINDAGVIETSVENLGNIYGYGFQLTGALKPVKAVAFNPYFKLINISTQANNTARLYGINNNHRMSYETGLSAIVSFKYDISASLQFQYKSPQIEFQGLSFSDALYFISLEKTFRKNFKIGVTSAVPLVKRFTYQGQEIKGMNFYSQSEGNIRLPAFPVWLKFEYQFNSGKKISNITRSKEETDKMPRKGF